METSWDRIIVLTARRPEAAPEFGTSTCSVVSVFFSSFFYLTLSFQFFFFYLSLGSY
jgi:hypothetical protein